MLTDLTPVETWTAQLRAEIEAEAERLEAKRQVLQEADDLLGRLKRANDLAPAGRRRKRPGKATPVRRAAKPARAAKSPGKGETRAAALAGPSTNSRHVDLALTAIELLREHGSLRPSVLRDRLKTSRRTIDKAIAPLLANGQVVAEGKTNSRVYRLQEKPHAAAKRTTPTPARAEPVQARPAEAAKHLDRAIDAVMTSGASYKATEVLRRVNADGGTFSLEDVQHELGRAVQAKQLKRIYIPDANEVRYQKLAVRR